MNSRSQTRYDAVCIGAGASGLVCAATLLKRGRRTALIEQNKKSGRKLYATGNGRCNLANAVISDSAYYRNSFAASLVTEDSVKEYYDFLASLGIRLTNRDGYLYPSSMQASSVVWALTDAARLAGAEFLYDTEIRTVSYDPAEGFLLDAGDKMICTDRLVLTTGSPAAAQLGSAKSKTLYHLLDQLNVPYTKFSPALCPLETEEDVSPLAGVRVQAGLTLLEKECGTDSGELQLTEYGLSGIVTFNLSTLAERKDRIRIDLLPSFSGEEEFLGILLGQSGERRMFAALNGILPEKLCAYFLEKEFGTDAMKKEILGFTEEDRKRLYRSLRNWTLTVSGKKGDMGQACRGGIHTSVIDPESMKIKAPGLSDEKHALAAAGEVIDVVGRCGGYNLMFAMISGLRAGQRV